MAFLNLSLHTPPGVFYFSNVDLRLWRESYTQKPVRAQRARTGFVSLLERLLQSYFSSSFFKLSLECLSVFLLHTLLHY